MADHIADQQQAAAAASLGSYEDLLESLATLSEADDTPFCDCAFSLTPDQFEDFLELYDDGYTIPCKLGQFDYDGETLYFKNMGLIHDNIGGLLDIEIHDQLRDLKDHPEIGSLVRGMWARGSIQVRTTATSFNKPDFSHGPREPSSLPSLVGEVSYSHRFSRHKLSEKYQAYLVNTNGKIRTVICIDLYYAGGGKRALKTATELDRSAVSIWTMRRGQIATVMDWVPLS